MLSFIENKAAAPVLLRLALGGVFLYAAVSSLVDPLSWVGYLPSLATEHFNGQVLIRLFAMYELTLAAWLLSGWQTAYAALLCALTLLAISVTNLRLLAISFRDLGLMLAALALYSLSTSRTNSK